MVTQATENCKGIRAGTAVPAPMGSTDDSFRCYLKVTTRLPFVANDQVGVPLYEEHREPLVPL